MWRDAEGKIDRFRYTVDKTKVVLAFRGSDGVLRGSEEPIPVRTTTVTVAGEVDYSLYLAMESAGEGAWLTLTLVDMLAWDVDFFTETQKGDRFRIVVEKRWSGDDFVGYGAVLGAEYAMVSGKTHRALRYEFADGKVGYYNEEGKAVEKAFLKSPIRFASITSRYGMRRHPILKYVRAHRGVDYGAPMGTEIWSVGDGVVTFAGHSGGYGRVVMIRHTNGIQTRYAHLRGYAKGIRSGARVRQKQVIGYVGKSGLATGPHLHFEVLRNGRHMNPLVMTAPPAPPIPPALIEDFREHIAPVLEEIVSRERLVRSPGRELSP
jgi:murein DD-endopeptidase MepM/ murein hydrolase activator NlpD